MSSCFIYNYAEEDISEYCLVAANGPATRSGGFFNKPSPFFFKDTAQAAKRRHWRSLAFC
jgi:hypothetical protein